MGIQKYISKLDSLEFGKMYQNDFFLTWDKTFDELQAVWTVAEFWDVMDLCQGGVIASHSNARAVCDHTRNLTDEQITAIIEHQGVIGLNFYENFVGGSRDLEAVRRHLDHILALGGAKCVALGGDWDGAELVEPLSHITRLSGLYTYLLHHGYGEELLHDVFYNNLMRVVRQS